MPFRHSPPNMSWHLCHFRDTENVYIFSTISARESRRGRSRASRALTGEHVTRLERLKDLNYDRQGYGGAGETLRAPMSTTNLPRYLAAPAQPAQNLTEIWCGGPESNRHVPCGTRDFKSLASTSSATPAH